MRVKTRTGHPLRLICYLDPARGQAFEFLTNEPDLPPGVLAELYRRRWDIEKVFDALKNKLGETKAWATSLGSRATQAQFLRLTHNLLLLYEQVLEQRHGVVNHAEDQRRQQRLKQMVAAVAKAGQALSTRRRQLWQATRRSVNCAPPSATNSRKPPPCSASRLSMQNCKTLSSIPIPVTARSAGENGSMMLLFHLSKPWPAGSFNHTMAPVWRRRSQDSASYHWDGGIYCCLILDS